MSETQHVIPVRTNLIVFALLMGLLALTVGAAFFDVGDRLGGLGVNEHVASAVNLAIALAIAVMKAVLIMLFFMHLMYSARLTWVFAGAAFVWLGILLVLTLSDYFSRDWLGILGK